VLLHKAFEHARLHAVTLEFDNVVDAERVLSVFRLPPER
jgi:hypothetical protein